MLSSIYDSKKQCMHVNNFHMQWLNVGFSSSSLIYLFQYLFQYMVLHICMIDIFIFPAIQRKTKNKRDRQIIDGWVTSQKMVSNSTYIVFYKHLTFFFDNDLETWSALATYLKKHFSTWRIWVSLLNLAIYMWVFLQTYTTKLDP